MNYREIYKSSVSTNKMNEDRNNILLFYVTRPISIILTGLLLNTKITPTIVTKISVVFLFAGFCLMSFGQNMQIKVSGWLFFMLWGILDCVDGNLARSKNMMSQQGDLWDTMGGYIAIIFLHYSVAIAAYFECSVFSFCEPYMILIIGGISAIIAIFPRLMMQKKRASHGETDVIRGFTDKSKFSFSKKVALNLISPIGMIQIILLFCLIFHALNIFVIAYFIANLCVMFISLNSILK